MKKTIALFILIVILILNFIGQNAISQTVYKEEVTQNKMNFYEAVQYSLQNNNNIKAMRYNLSATERDIGIARSEIMPKARFVEGFTVTNNPVEALGLKLNQSRVVGNDLLPRTLNHPDSTTNFLTAGIIEQPIYDRKSHIAIKIAKKEYSANGYSYLRKQEELVNEVSQAYLTVNTTDKLVKVLEQTLKDVEEHLELAKKKYNNNEKNPDFLRAKTEVETNKQNLISAKIKLNITKRKLGLLLGIKDVVETSGTTPEIILQDMDYYRGVAVYRSDIRAFEARLKNEKNNIQFAKSDWYPTLNAVASYNFYNNSYPFGAEGQNYIAGAVFKWTAFDGNKRKYEILKAKDKELEAREYLEGQKKQVDFEVYKIYSKIEELKKNLELALETKKAAEEDRKIILARWEKSNLPFVALVDAQTALDNARVDIVKIQNDLQSALINLSYESGIIFKELALE